MQGAKVRKKRNLANSVQASYKLHVFFSLSYSYCVTHVIKKPLHLILHTEDKIWAHPDVNWCA